MAERNVKAPATIWIGFDKDGERTPCTAGGECKHCESEGVKRFRYRLDTTKPAAKKPRKVARATGRTFTRMAELYAENRALKAAKSEPAQAVDADEVERVARVLHNQSHLATEFDDLSRHVRQGFIDTASAAIAAIRSRPVVVDAEVVALVDRLDELIPAADRAHVVWGLDGRVPSRDHYLELASELRSVVSEAWPQLSSALRSLVKK